MNLQKFNTWLKLWRLGLAPDPDIVATIVDVSREEKWFYKRLKDLAEELQPMGLIQGKKSLEAPLHLTDRYWLGPEDVSAQFTEQLNELLNELKTRNRHRNFFKGEAYQGFRYWSVSGGGQALEDWRLYWSGKVAGQIGTLTLI